MHRVPDRAHPAGRPGDVAGLWSSSGALLSPDLHRDALYYEWGVMPQWARYNNHTHLLRPG